MTERKIQDTLFPWLAYERSYKLCIPNYTPARWHECDVFAVTKADMGVEFEIKISRSDFKADASKVDKHRKLFASHESGPSRFYYVVPEGLITVEEVPDYAGLLYIVESQRVHTTVAPRLYVREVKKAPKLHRQPVPEKITDHARGVFYWRFWNLRRGLTESADNVRTNETAPE